MRKFFDQEFQNVEIALDWKNLLLNRIGSIDEIINCWIHKLILFFRLEEILAWNLIFEFS